MPATGGADSGASALGEPAFMAAPEVPAEVSGTKECDVLVLGLGLSGICAARAAAEAGAKVIGVEKQARLGIIGMAGDFGIYGSKIQKDLNMELADKAEVVNQLMKDMTFRPNARLLGYWYDHSGEDFDWLVEGSDYEVVPTSATPASGGEGMCHSSQVLSCARGLRSLPGAVPVLQRHRHDGAECGLVHGVVPVYRRGRRGRIHVQHVCRAAHQR